MAKLLSGKVGVTTFAGLSTSRNQIVGGQPTFIGLDEVEPNLGLSPQNDYVLFGDANGARRWGELTPAGSVNGITVRDEGIAPVGLAGSITILDIVGDGVVAIQTHITQGGVQVGLATLSIPANTLDGENGSGFLTVSGINTIRVGAGLTIFAPSGTTGIASIGNLTQTGVDVYDNSSFLRVSPAAELQAGLGLSVTEPETNRAKFDFTGLIPRLKVTGISTFNQTQLSDAIVAGIVTASSYRGDGSQLTGIVAYKIFEGDTSVECVDTGSNGKIEFKIDNALKLEVDNGGNTIPGADNASNLGSSTKRWANIYAADMHYSNEGDKNSVDGTWGSYTIQEGENDLFLLNNRNGKKYKFNLTEVN